MASRDYQTNVFLNCPFDDKYKPIRDAIVFAIHDCGFRVRCALEEQNSGTVRVTKLYQIIGQCRFGVHDLSRTEVSKDSLLPRFNMPLELGIFLGASEYGSLEQKQKGCLILDSERYRYQRYISDLAGQDPESHANNPETAIRRVRDFLSHHSKGAVLPGGTEMVKRYGRFQSTLPDILKRAKIKRTELIYNDYTTFVVEWLMANP